MFKLNLNNLYTHFQIDFLSVFDPYLLFKLDNLLELKKIVLETRQIKKVYNNLGTDFSKYIAVNRKEILQAHATLTK